jgi:hypothetical protein
VAFLLFIDESGQDGGASPYEVLAGAAVHDSHLWQLVCDIQESERDAFGRRISSGEDELKARRLLKRKTYRLAAWVDPISRSRRRQLAKAALDNGAHATREQIAALAQAKLDFAAQVLRLCELHNVRFFASMVERRATRPLGTRLRKDYAYLFERYFYLLNEQAQHERGIVVFDELERSSAHLLAGQMSEYFQGTPNGRTRVSRIIPEPMFVHSDLTTGVQIADLVAYILAWNVRFGACDGPRRSEMDALGTAVLRGRHHAVVPNSEREDFVVWSFSYIRDLRPQVEMPFEQ